MKFGDYCIIEQKRYGAENEFYKYKVIGSLMANYYVPVPVDAVRANWIETGESCECVKVICCGPVEEVVQTFRLQDVKAVELPAFDLRPPQVKTMPVCVITGSEIDFRMEVSVDDIERVCQDIWDFPAKYYDAYEVKAGREDAYYKFLKFLWVIFPDDRKDLRVADIAKI